MKLDTRIMGGKRPLTCFDAEEAKAFITSDANSPRQRHAKLVLRSIYEILMVVYESEYKSWEKEE